MKQYAMDLVRAAQWVPGDMEKAGELIGYLMAHGYEPTCVGGMGDATTLRVVGILPALPPQSRTLVPGDWLLIHPDGQLGKLPDHVFRTAYQEVTS